MFDKPIKDPFITPIEITPGGRFEEVLKALIFSVVPKDTNLEKTKPMLASPAKDPKNVIGAEALDTCLKCKQEVWISPSAFKIYKDCLVFCADCLIAKYKEKYGNH